MYIENEVLDRWEYKEELSLGYLRIEDLNKLGEAGWELVDILATRDGVRHVFKRKMM